MKGAILWKLFQAIPTLLGVAILVFLLLSFSGDPVAVKLGPEATPQMKAALRHQMGLDRPLPIQFASWLGNALRGEWGTSYATDRAVVGEIKLRLPATIELAVTTMFFATFIAVVVALISVRKPGGLFDGVSRAVLFVLLAMPGFWLGIELIILFARRFSLLPPSGRGEGSLRSHIAHLILPTITLGTYTMASLCRVLRASMLEVLHSDYVRTARAKGVSSQIVLIKHAFRNALIPFVTLSGIQIGSLLEGSIIVESVFGWPGIGQLMIEAIKGRDVPPALAAVLLIAVTYILINVVVDMLYVVIDPRVRLDGGAGR